MRRKLTLAAAVLALALTGQPAAAARPDESLATEARLAKQHPGLFRREGDTLVIGSKRFTDTCASADAGCATYRAVQVRGDYVGVRMRGSEDGDYLFVRRDGQRSTSVGDDPVPSPNGKRFFVLVRDPNTDWGPLKGAAIWEWRQGPVRLRHVDEAITYVNRLVAWRGNACVEMLAAPSDEARDAGKTHRVWLAETDGDWQLTRKRPSICTG